MIRSRSQEKEHKTKTHRHGRGRGFKHPNLVHVLQQKPTAKSVTFGTMCSHLSCPSSLWWEKENCLRCRFINTQNPIDRIELLPKLLLEVECVNTNGEDVSPLLFVLSGGRTTVLANHPAAFLMSEFMPFERGGEKNGKKNNSLVTVAPWGDLWVLLSS